ncbi:Ldh family oxidoreductase [Roseomonas sp. M0104]|uniref:Ldh family oxidoreductase n=1 Tax=Teichococcus coralli TaxID=2545983 RepID=A0A845B810_9PROT|nr:Ldh family oxidoreductase [Pseudoroseomonas coralli]MXP62845.1 Ldh family oxidoreductase [Pseudoroseomonas coralli]
MTETKIPEAELLALATRALARGGMPEDAAAEAARVLVLADMFGLRTHGISRVAQYLERVRLGGIDAGAEVAVSRVAPGLSMVDGRNGVGTLVGMRALRAATESAREVGIGAAFARGSNHFGPVLPYAWLAAREGFASFIASNATTTIAPWGGKDTRVGNNPMGIGMPNPGGDPIILDMALSVAARAKIRKLAEQGAPMPEGWATDAGGQPTTDPVKALKGFLLPVGGHKGYGLAVMIDLLAGLLSGAAYLTHVQAWDKNPGVAQNLGHVFILIDTKRMQAQDWLQERMADFGGILRGTPPADPSAPVMAPGDREMATYARSRREGVAVAAADLRAVEALAAA